MDITKPVAALFDFDGVIMDTEFQYSLFWTEQGKKYHPEIENFSTLVKGTTLAQIFANYFTGMNEVQASIKTALDKYESEEMEYNYIPGIIEFVDSLREKGVKVAIVTSSDRKKMDVIYRIHPKLNSHFDRILTAEDFTKSKPDPECFLLGAKVFDTVPENCFVFEDSFNGLKSGNSAGMAVIGLATTNPRKAIEDKANCVIDDFREFTYDKMIALKR